jgi:hypothetical protein
MKEPLAPRRRVGVGSVCYTKGELILQQTHSTVQALPLTIGMREQNGSGTHNYLDLDSFDEMPLAAQKMLRPGD